MSIYQTMPSLSGEDFANLEQSIRDNGIQVPVIVDDEGHTIDGHHRQKIAESLGITCPVEVKFGLTDAQKRTLSLSLNLDRRQLSREQRREVIEGSLKSDPELSNRQHAERTGADHKTVGNVRDRLESTGEIPQSDVRTSADGRERPASQPDRPVTKITDTETHKQECYFDADGTQVEAPAAPERAGRAPKPVLEGEAAAQLNRVEGMQHFSDAIFTLWQLTYPQHRQWLTREVFTRASDAVPPDDRERANPATFRAIADALNTLADEMETSNV